jgi:DNA-binding transcriptional regulator YbjK
VLAPRGLSACTAREVAAAGPLTKSAIHCYFADMDVLIDRAMAEHVANFEANLRSAGAASSDPLASFWNIIDAYLATFRDQPQVTYLWLEYWIDAARKGRTATIAQLNQRITTVLAERLQAAGVPAPTQAARAIFVFLLGAIQDQAINDGPAPDRICQHIAALAGLQQRGPGTQAIE